MYNWWKQKKKNKLWGKVDGNIHSDDENPVETGKQSNQNPFNEFIINLVCSLHTEKYLLSVFSPKSRSFVAGSERNKNLMFNETECTYNYFIKLAIKLGFAWLVWKVRYHFIEANHELRCTKHYRSTSG